MKTITDFINNSESLNEGAFDIIKNIESAPAWEKLLIDWIVDNGGVVTGGVGCDCLGRKVEPGDWVVFLDAGGSYGAGKRLNVGKVIAVKKQINIALFIPRESRSYFKEEDIEKINRPSEYVFKIPNPEKVASEVLK